MNEAMAECPLSLRVKSFVDTVAEKKKMVKLNKDGQRSGWFNLCQHL